MPQPLRFTFFIYMGCVHEGVLLAMQEQNTRNRKGNVPMASLFSRRLPNSAVWS